MRDEKWKHGNKKTLEEIVAELDRKTLNNLVCRHADNGEDFHWMILKAAMK